MDALSDVLRAVRLTGAVFFDVHTVDPWVAETPPGATIVGRMFPDADHLIPYHVVTSGGCWGGLVGEPPVRLDAGDVLMFPHGDAHALSSAPGMRDAPRLALYRKPSEVQLPFSIALGSSPGVCSHIVCGFLACDARPFNPLLAALPPVIHIRAADTGALGVFVQYAVAESHRPRIGGACVLEHLSELMFVDVVRRYLETLPEDRTGWLAGLREPFVGRALEALHRSPATDWTLESLAREVGLSRSALAERFTQYVGMPPMQYLTQWRMQLAATHLLSGRAGIAEVAERVGYASEAAFSRAFKRAVGRSPGDWRNDRQGRGVGYAALTAPGGAPAH